MRTSVLTAALSLAAVLSLTACATQPTPERGGAAAFAVEPAVDGVSRFRLGRLAGFSIQDATAERPNDGTTFAIGEDPAAVRAVLASAGAPTETLGLAVNVLVVRTGNRVVAIDSGSGTAFGSPGRFPERLAAAKLTMEAITDVVISHSHGDHVGGLVRDGRPAFPNARIHMAVDEWTFLQGQAPQAALVAAIRPQVNAIRPGATIAPGVRAVAVEGHTPGHIAAEITSDGRRMLAVGDTVHHYVLSVRKPEWTIRFDRDAPLAERSRRALLAAAARERTLLFVPHFPSPGLGTVRVEGDGFAWEPAG